ncbi:hypothetical protein [Gemmatimonas sp.]|uniref:hypothetical protein n=1 Tax=Gemmatimonas sp. TaxID=1962908 RepID=UPI0039838B26
MTRGIAGTVAITLLLGTAVLPAQSTQSPPTALKTRYVMLVLSDGVRWQEVFNGADASLMGKSGNVSDTAALRRDFWREAPQSRRQALFPFLWGTVAAQGQLFGDSAGGSQARITNTMKFSYPGYSETFTGFADARIDSNDHPPNVNTTVFEWLNRDAVFRGRVAAFATWNAFRRIINAERSGVPVYDGWTRGVAPSATPRAALLRELYATTIRLWPDNAFDALMHQSLLEYLTAHEPRLLFVGYGETDEWAHAGKYDLYLRSARNMDGYLAQLWARVQRDPRTRDKTTLIVSTDHGRGWGRDWTDHGQDVAGAEFIWTAVIGPDTPARGVRGHTPVQQAQVAATIAALLGRDWQKAEPRAAPPLPVFR